MNCPYMSCITLNLLTSYYSSHQSFFYLMPVNIFPIDHSLKHLFIPSIFFSYPCVDPFHFSTSCIHSCMTYTPKYYHRSGQTNHYHHHYGIWNPQDQNMMGNIQSKVLHYMNHFSPGALSTVSITVFVVDWEKSLMKIINNVFRETTYGNMLQPHKSWY